MSLKSYFKVKSYHTGPSAVLLILRVVAGIGMMLHGWGKMQNPMGWMGEASNIPGVFQLLAVVSEFGGGLAWVLGLLFPLASLGVLFTMAGAAGFHILKGDSFVGGYELASIYLCLSLLFITFGPGNYSADKKIF